MPKPLQYNNDSLIYCEGEESDKVILLQNGKVSLVSEDITTGENVKETVLPGDFFGVRSALGRYPRDENAIVVSDASVAVFTVPEFELYAMSDTKIILNLLKIFSGQIRQTHRLIASLAKTRNLRPDEGLFTTGEKYLKDKRYSHAKYVFTRYLDLYPKGKDADKAAKNLQLAEDGIAQSAKGEEVLPEKFNAGKAYYNAINLIKTEKFEEAMRIFTQVSHSENPEWAAKGVYEIGRCLFFLNKYEDCIKHYQNMFAEFPKHQDIKDAMFHVGQACEKTGKKESAADWYEKILAMPGSDNDKIRAKTIQALEAIGG
jgi:TolA-binding protein